MTEDIEKKDGDPMTITLQDSEGLAIKGRVWAETDSNKYNKVGSQLTSVTLQVASDAADTVALPKSANDITVTMNGKKLYATTDWTYATGVITFVGNPKVTGNIVITAKAANTEVATIKVSGTGLNLEVTGTGFTKVEDNVYTAPVGTALNNRVIFYLTPADNDWYTVPTSLTTGNMTMNGTTTFRVTNEWTYTSGMISFVGDQKVTGDITISANAAAKGTPANVDPAANMNILSPKGTVSGIGQFPQNMPLAGKQIITTYNGSSNLTIPNVKDVSVTGTGITSEMYDVTTGVDEATGKKTIVITFNSTAGTMPASLQVGGNAITGVEELVAGKDFSIGADNKLVLDAGIADAIYAVIPYGPEDVEAGAATPLDDVKKWVNDDAARELTGSDTANNVLATWFECLSADLATRATATALTTADNSTAGTDNYLVVMKLSAAAAASTKITAVGCKKLGADEIGAAARKIVPTVSDTTNLEVDGSTKIYNDNKLNGLTVTVKVQNKKVADGWKVPDTLAANAITMSSTVGGNINLATEGVTYTYTPDANKTSAKIVFSAPESMTLSNVKGIVITAAAGKDIATESGLSIYQKTENGIAQNAIVTVNSAGVATAVDTDTFDYVVLLNKTMDDAAAALAAGNWSGWTTGMIKSAIAAKLVEAGLYTDVSIADSMIKAGTTSLEKANKGCRVLVFKYADDTKGALASIGITSNGINGDEETPAPEAVPGVYEVTITTKFAAGETITIAGVEISFAGDDTDSTKINVNTAKDEETQAAAIVEILKSKTAELGGDWKVTDIAAEGAVITMTQKEANESAVNTVSVTLSSNATGAATGEWTTVPHEVAP